MFERFTNKARHVVVLAQEEARSLHHNYIGTEHLLLGLFGEPASAAGRVLDRLGMTHDGARIEVTDKVGIGKKPQVSGHIPFTPRAKKVLELGLRESAALHHGYIGTEHLLLGMVREGDGAAAEILLEHGGDMATVRAAVLDLVPPGAPSRRWLRRRTATTADDPDEGEAGFDDGLRTTPAAEVSLDEAARLAGAQPVGSHHLLLATLADPSTAAARALASLGVDLDQARAALREAEVTGTSDELPEDIGRRQLRIHVTGEGLSIEATDPVIVGLGRAALAALGDLAERPGGAEDGAEGGGDAAARDDTGSPRGVIRGDLPVSVSLSGVWQALRDSLEDIRRRAMAPGAHADSGDAA